MLHTGSSLPPVGFRTPSSLFASHHLFGWYRIPALFRARGNEPVCVFLSASWGYSNLQQKLLLLTLERVTIAPRQIHLRELENVLLDLTYSSTLKMGAVRTFFRNVDGLRDYNPKYRTLQKKTCVNENILNNFSALLVHRPDHSGRAVLRHEPSSPARTLGIVGSNPTRGMDVCVRLFCVCVVLCVGSGLAIGSSPVQGVLPSVYWIKTLKKRPRFNKKTVEP
jgi:hypothetical protein